jgi:hypothetical protein
MREEKKEVVWEGHKHELTNQFRSLSREKTCGKNQVRGRIT